MPGTYFKRSFLPVACVFLALSLQAQFKLHITEFRLKNGLRVVLNRDTTFNDVALYLLADAGFGKEAPGQHGLAHLFEHVMLPTRYFYNPELSRNGSRHSINSNAQVFNDYVRYYHHFDKNGLDYGLIQLADRLDFQPDSLTDEVLLRHVQNVNSELARSESFGSFRWRPAFREALARNIFGTSHPYGHEQSFTDINRATRKDIHYWFKRWYGARNATLLVMGNADPDSLRIKTERYFGHIDPGKQSVEIQVPVPVHTVPRRAVFSFSADKHVVYNAWAIPGYGTGDEDAFRLLATLLAHPATGVVTQALKAAGIKNATVFSNVESFKHASVFDLGIEFSDERDGPKAETLLRNAVHQLMTRPVDRQKLQAAFSQYNLLLLKSMEDIGMNDERVAELGKGTLFVNNPVYYERRLAQLRSLSPEQLQRTISRWMKHPPYTAMIRSEQPAAAPVAYDFKAGIPFTAPSSPALLPITHKKISDHLHTYLVSFQRLPLVDYLVVMENSPGLTLDEMQMYKGSLTRFFEQGTSSGGKKPGWQSEELVRNNSLIYKLSVEKGEAQPAFEWLAERLANFVRLERQPASVNPFSPLEKSLALLKQTVMPAARGTGHYPLSAIHLVTVGDVRGDEFMALKAGASKALISKPAGPRTAGYSGSANLLLKDIGESPTTFLTLAHFLQPANIKEEVFQQLILHLLRAKLMTNLREKNGLAYEVYPYSITAAADHHLAYWQTSVPAEKTERTLEEIRRELEQLPADIEKRIAGAKSRVVAELKQKFKSMQAIEVTVLDMIEYRRSPDYFARLMEALDTLDPAEFAAFVKQKATPSQFRLMMFTTPKQIQGLQARGETMQLVSDQ